MKQRYRSSFYTHYDPVVFQSGEWDLIDSSFEGQLVAISAHHQAGHASKDGKARVIPSDMKVFVEAYNKLNS